MSIRHRTLTYRGEIKISRQDMRLAKLGRKTCTIRLGTALVGNDEIDLSDGRDRVPVRIVLIENDRNYRGITEDEAQADGADSLQALDEDLRRFYGPLDPAQPMTLIHFELVSPGSGVESSQAQLWD
jgi:hypothetical protein